LPGYGPDFTYHHYAGIRHLPVVLGAAAGLAGLIAVAQIPPARRLLLSRIRTDDGPSAEVRAHSWFSVRFTARADGRTVVTEVSGGDPGYDETATMLAEAALCLALDDVPPTAGQVTTAQALGTLLIDRLVAAGITFRTVSDTRN
jgi:saccharopine dehydrogenase (NAD+, L-glutamate forming)